MLYLIDTDILISILQKKDSAIKNSISYLRIHKRFKISCLSYYECLRGYKTICSEKKLNEFNRLLNIMRISN